ncbi:MAG TPA: DNA polymerase III subunit gamma/tau [Pyrinomonadaceae bacterium]|nr:DNA polymerase III subunit gamma/tau [Pyrinomonadaceae bacterium]
MSYQVIARKWRPQTFEEVTGQEAITQTLRNAIEHDRLHHAYLFSGARGVGKTTTARLLAKALNCHKTAKPNPLPCSPEDADACPSCVEISESRSIDVFEFDAASHTGVDDIREIILESINIAPARDRYKIFIIDEVHMLSNSSFNALLKTLEEPPPNVAFIMATTELHKVPITILSRCQEFEFRTIPLNKIFARLKLIAEAEKINITDEALREISRSGEGSMRDAQSNFDQVISFSGERIEVPDVANALGLASAEMLVRIVTSIAHNQPAEALNVVDDLIARGHDLRNYCRDLLSFFRDLLIAKVAGGSENLLETAILSADELNKYALHFSESDLIRFFNSLSETESKLREAAQSRYVLEIGLVKLIEMRRVAPIEKILERLAKLENALSNGNSPVETVLKAETPLEKKTLKVDFPLEEIPFPIKEVPSLKPQVPNFTPQISNHTDLSEPPEFAGSFAVLSEPPESAGGFSAFEKTKPAPELQISDYKFQTDEKSEVDEFNKVTSSDISNLKSRFAEEQKSTDTEELTTDEGQNPQFQVSNYKSLEYIASMPVKMMPISSEDLEHFDEDKLDTAYENKLSRAGDNLFPIANAAKIVEELVGVSQSNGFSASGENQNGSSAAATAPAKSKPVFEMPNFDYDDESEELPVLSENPTPEELLAYAQKHPNVKKVLRAFRGKIIEVKKLS